MSSAMLRAVREHNDIVEIYAQYDGMVRLAVLLTGSSSVAESAVQQAMMRVTARYASLRSPEAYLRQAVVNGCRRRRRTAARRRDLEGSYAAAFMQGDSHGIEFLEALVTLRSRERAAVVLRYFCDLPEGEISAMLHCAPPTVRILLARGLRKLRAVIDVE